MSEKMTTPLPCPFCGNGARKISKLLDERFGYALEVSYGCPVCGFKLVATGDGSKGGYADNRGVEEAALRKWNTRTNDASREARISIRGHYDETGSTPQELERFAEFVAATERTACARHFEVAMRNAVTAEREACAQPHPAAAAEDDDLYWRLHSISTSLESCGFFDEHDNPDAYKTVLDAMNFVKQHSGQRGDK